MRRILYTLILAGMAVMMTACHGKSMPDTYVPGMDFQFFTGGIAQYTEDGAYIRVGDFVYFYDRSTKEMIPLCDKPDCLHDKETDPDRKRKCNANLYMIDDKFYQPIIQYYEGNLYIMYKSLFADGGQRKSDRNTQFVLYKHSGNGSYKEEIWRSEEVVSSFLVHRGSVYYITGGYKSEEDGIKCNIFLKAFSLDNPKREKELYHLGSNVATSSIDKLTGYGNHLYFSTNISNTLEDGSYEHEDHFFEMSLRDYSINELSVPGLSSKSNVNGITFMDDKLIIIPYTVETNSVDEFYIPTDIYEADLDGDNIRSVLKGIPQGYYIKSDGQNLYIDNAICAYMGDPERDPEFKYYVYDSEYQLMDTYTVSKSLIKSWAWDFPVGCPEWGCCTLNNSAEGVRSAYCWDKKNIGSYDGKELDIELIDYDYPEPYVVQELFTD